VVEPADNVIWVGNIVEIILMATKTVAAHSFELAVLVAEKAVGRQVRPG
jgi:hypothetical protein